MRKTLMAIGAVGAMAMATAANAWSWQIEGASANNQLVSGGEFSMRLPVNDYFSTTFPAGGDPEGAANLNQLHATNILSNLGVSLAVETLTYFGWVDSQNRAYMGVAFLNAKSSSFDATLLGDNWAGGEQGLYSTNAIDIVDDMSLANISVSSGRIFLMVMGGYPDGSPQITLNFNSPTEGFEVQYLSRINGSSAWSVLASGTATANNGSGLNSATYVIPVPAPVMLAAAGLVGGLAIRRRIVR
jgi:hypothetical protein